MTGDEALRFMRSEEGLCAARDYLSRTLRMDAEAALHLAHLDRLRKKQRSASRDAEERRRREAELARIYHSLAEMRREIEAVLARVPGDMPREVLRRRYVEGSPFFRIAMALNYDERQIYRFHRQGLEHVALQMALGQIALS